MKKGISSFTLKMIAVVTMLTDHIGLLFFPEHMWLRAIGRVSFPIYAFLIVEGVYHTRNIQKYLLRLGVLALISEIPYNLFLSERVFNFRLQNIFCSLFLAVLAIFLAMRVTNFYVQFGIFLCAMFLGAALNVDYSWVGLLLIFLLWWFRDKSRLMQCVSLAAVFVFAWGGIYLCALIAIIPIALYDGREGLKCQPFFYGIYPIHLLILWGLHLLM